MDTHSVPALPLSHNITAILFQVIICFGKIVVLISFEHSETYRQTDSAALCLVLYGPSTAESPAEGTWEQTSGLSLTVQNYSLC